MLCLCAPPLWRFTACSNQQQSNFDLILLAPAITSLILPLLSSSKSHPASFLFQLRFNLIPPPCSPSQSVHLVHFVVFPYIADCICDSLWLPVVSSLFLPSLSLSLPYYPLLSLTSDRLTSYPPVVFLISGLTIIVSSPSSDI